MAEIVKKACPECPFRRDSVAGYLGAADSPQEFLGPHWHGPLRLPCHMQVDWESPTAQDDAEEAPLCRGLITMAKNGAKLLDDPASNAAKEEVERDPEEFFAFPHEFIAHHGGGDRGFFG